MAGISVESDCVAEVRREGAKFIAERAREGANETPRARQKGTFERDSSYMLGVPYHDDGEQVTVVLRHGRIWGSSVPASCARQ